jgi:hypothetical protein
LYANEPEVFVSLLGCQHLNVGFIFEAANEPEVKMLCLLQDFQLPALSLAPTSMLPKEFSALSGLDNLISAGMLGLQLSELFLHLPKRYAAKFDDRLKS